MTLTSRLITIGLLNLGNLVAQSAPKARNVTITEYPLPADSGPYGITPGPDGALWFTGDTFDASNKIGRITTTGVVTQFSAPPAGVGGAISWALDGNLWFVLNYGNSNIGKITPQGNVTGYETLSGNNVIAIITGPDGALWMTENGNQIGRMTTTGVAKNEYSVPTNPQFLTLGPDGAIWFTGNRPDMIGRITRAGVVTTYPLPDGSQPRGITPGPDGALWFTEFDANSGNKIGRITTTGAIKTYPLPALTLSQPEAITWALDGGLWFTASTPGTGAGDKIGRISAASGVVTAYQIPTANAGAHAITIGLDGALWFTEHDGNAIGHIQ
jgi:virginiamycin B lyase